MPRTVASQDLIAIQPGSALLTALKSGTTEEQSFRQRVFTRWEPADLIGVFVSFTRSPDQLWSWWTTQIGDPPSEAGIIAVNDLVRSGATSSISMLPSYSEDDPDLVTVSPEDSTDIGQTIAQYLDTKNVGAGDCSEQVLVWFDSLTVLFQYCSHEEAFRFLHLLTAQLRALDAVMYIHVEPGAHDRETMATIRPLFDAVITAADEDDGVRITDRDDVITTRADLELRSGPTATRSDEDLSQQTVFELLGNDRRYHVLAYLAQAGPDTTVKVRDVAEYIAGAEADGTSSKSTQQSIYVSLHQTHLDKLAAHGIVERHPDTTAISAGSEFDAIRPYLD